MAIVDDQGRVFGRVNLVDALVGVLLLGLIPLVYAAVVVFRTPPPSVTAVEPATLVAGPGLRVTIRGENFRPYMRVSFGHHQGKDFLFKSTTEAQINLNDMPAGVYDVVLYDVAQEQSRLIQAFTVTPSPLPASRVIIAGTFGNLDQERAAKLMPGMDIPGLGTIAAVGDPMPEATRVHAGPVIEIPVDRAVRLPATLEVPCQVLAPHGTPQCQALGVMLQPTVMLFAETPIGAVPFQIDQVRGSQPLEDARITVRFRGPAAIVSQIRKGDVDRGAFVNPLAAGAAVTDIVSSRLLSADMHETDVAFLLQGQRGANGWIYSSLPLRVGAQWVLRTPRYELLGTVLRITPEWTSPFPVK